MGKIQPRDFGTLAALQAAVEELLCNAFSNADDAPTAVMLSGGSTPLPVYEAITKNPVTISPALYLTFSDDRHVPIDSPDSNHGNTLPMIQALQVPADRVIAVNTGVSLEESAKQFEADFQHFFDAGGRLSLALLGMGGDTHTCSLFTQENLAAAKGHLAIPVVKDAPPHRVSVTPAVLECAERVVFLVAGASKAAVIEQLLNHPETTIAGQAVAGCEHVELWYAL